jgi:hypothetical protein
MMQDFECEQRAWQLLVELVANPQNNNDLCSRSQDAMLDSFACPCRLRPTPALPLPAFQEIEPSATDESLTPSLNDFSLFRRGRKRTKFLSIPPAMPARARPCPVRKDR